MLNCSSITILASNFHFFLPYSSSNGAAVIILSTNINNAAITVSVNYLLQLCIRPVFNPLRSVSISCLKTTSRHFVPLCDFFLPISQFLQSSLVNSLSECEPRCEVCFPVNHVPPLDLFLTLTSPPLSSVRIVLVEG